MFINNLISLLIKNIFSSLNAARCQTADSTESFQTSIEQEFKDLKKTLPYSSIKNVYEFRKMRKCVSRAILCTEPFFCRFSNWLKSSCFRSFNYGSIDVRTDSVLSAVRQLAAFKYNWLKNQIIELPFIVEKFEILFSYIKFYLSTRN